MTTDTTISKYLHEKVMGKCWHEPDGEAYRLCLAVICIHCGKELMPNPDYLNKNPTGLTS